MLDVSVVICSHNPRAEYFSRVLDALRSQTLPKERWQLIVVDNRSVPPLAANWDLSWHPNARHVNEGELGIAAARRRGIYEAYADLLIFIDDDNVLDPEYLQEVLMISAEYSWLGVWGSGHIEPEYEVQPQSNLSVYLPFLALRNIAAIQANSDFTSKTAMPWGAGMCLRKAIGLAYCQLSTQSPIQISSRRGKEYNSHVAMLGGEDVEICIVSCLQGFAMGIFPQLKLTHLIPKERVTESYLLKIGRAHATTEILIAYKWRKIMPRDPYSFIGLLGLLRSMIFYHGIHRKMRHAYWKAAVDGRRLILQSLQAKSHIDQPAVEAAPKNPRLSVTPNSPEAHDKEPVALTVLFSCHNGETVLPRALEGYVNQVPAGVPWKLVVVNNASTDRTSAILDEFSGVLPLQILQEPVPGKNRALNRGLAVREGKLIVLTDDDAIPHNTFLKAWATYLTKKTEYGLLGGRVELKFDQEPPEWLLRDRFKFDVLFAESRSNEGPVDAGQIFGPNMAVRSDIFDRGIRFDESIGPNGRDKLYPMGSETEFCYRVSRSGVASWFAQEPIVRHIIRPHQLTESYLITRGYRHGRGVAQQMRATGTLKKWGHGSWLDFNAYKHRILSWSPFPATRWKGLYFSSWDRGFRQEATREGGR